MLVKILLFSSLITVLSASLQLYLDYRTDLSQIHARLDEIPSSHLDALARGLWNYNNTQIDTLLGGLHRLPDMAMVTISSPQGQVIAQSGQRPSKGQLLERRYMLTHSSLRGDQVKLGTLLVTVSLERVHRRLFSRILVILGSQGVKTFLVSGFILLLFHNLVTRHLRTMATWAARTDLDQLNQPLQLSRPSASKPDELSRVTDAVNQMRHRIQHAVVALQAREAQVQEMNDVLERRVRERSAKLEQEEALLRATLESSREGVLVVDDAGWVRTFNTQFARMWRIPSHILRKRNEATLLSFAVDQLRDPETFRNKVEKLYHSGDKSLDIIEFRDGRIFERFSAPLLHKGKITGRVWTFLDITDRIQTEDMLKKLGAAVQQASDMISISNRHGHIQYVNPAFETISGYSANDVIGQAFLELFDDIKPTQANHHQVDENIEETLTRGLTWHGRIIRRARSGHEYETDTHLSPVRDEQGRICRTIEVSRDVTRETELENQLRQAHKLEAIGTLAGGIAHDFNNILAIIMGHADMTIHELKELMEQEPPQEDILNPQDMLKMIQVIHETSKRGAELVRQLLTFSRHSDEQSGMLFPGPHIQEAIHLMGSVLPREINIVADIDNKAGPVFSTPNTLHQLLMNLVNNSAHAMAASGGELHVRLHQIDLTSDIDPPPLIQPGAHPYVLLEVSDSGHGISEADQVRLFDPFFTTKPVNQGTGLGLSIVHGIVEKLGGQIDVKSLPNQGSCFSLWLPISEGEHNPVSTLVKHHTPNHERIMLVEDELHLISIMTRTLRDQDYIVESFTDSMQAWHHFQKQPDSYDLLVTGQSMPGFTGLKLIEHIRTLRPKMPIMVISGYGATIEVGELSNMRVISKPISAQQLLAKVATSLNDT
ncbi:MAG: PAS domain S-box protein [Magnetococcales bacterium]|nr:PAS domain S-box protein [Magnetococcales bacterium]